MKVIGNPQTIGEHLKKRRNELALLQRDVAERFGVCEDTITGWETSRSTPQIQYYPKLIEFLGYNPFPVDEATLGGRIKKYRMERGVSQKKFARMMHVDETTVRAWEMDKHKPVHKGMLELLERVIHQSEPSSEGSFLSHVSPNELIQPASLRDQAPKFF